MIHFRYETPQSVMTEADLAQLRERLRREKRAQVQRQMQDGLEATQ